MEMKIRRTLMGGFNRHDVVAYIQEISAVREREVGDLNRELERLSAELDAARRLGGDASAMRAELESTKAALAEATADLSRTASELETVREQAAKSAAKLAEYEQADMQLSEKLAELERVKARVTDIELEAHDRAHKIEQDARDAAYAARAEADRLVGELRWRFDDARNSAGQNLSNGVRELESMKLRLQSLMDSFNEINDKLGRISAKEVTDGDDQA